MRLAIPRSIKNIKGFSLVEVMVAVGITLFAGLAIFELTGVIVGSQRRASSSFDLSNHMTLLRKSLSIVRQCNSNLVGKVIPLSGSVPIAITQLNADGTAGPNLAVAEDKINASMKIKSVQLRLQKSVDDRHKIVEIIVQAEHLGKSNGNAVESESFSVFVEADPVSRVISKCSTSVEPTSQTADLDKRACELITDRSVELDASGVCKASLRQPCVFNSNSGDFTSRTAQCPLDGVAKSCVVYNYGTIPQILVARGYTDETEHQAGAPDYVTNFSGPNNNTCNVIYAAGLPVPGTSPKILVCCVYPEAP